jgi:hypothetical protein
MTSCVARSNLIALWIFTEEEEVSSPLAVEEVEEVEEVFSPLAVEEVEEVFSPLVVEEVSSLSRQERENEDLTEKRMARALIVLIVTTTISWILRRSCRSALCLWGISSSVTGGELAMTSHVSGHAFRQAIKKIKTLFASQSRGILLSFYVGIW